MTRTELQTVYSGKRVLLTGHTGFKGSWLLLMLKELGADVMGYALPPKHQNDLYNEIDGDNHCQSIIADIRDRERLRQVISSFQPDFVFHLAAQALVIDSYQYPVETYETNVMGSVYLMDALRLLDKPCSTLMITTDKVYENFETEDPYPESARLGGYDPYSNSKACAELAIGSYRNAFFNPRQYNDHLQGIASARSGNVIGGGDWSANRLVPDIARALINATPVVIRNPNAVRPWQHVLDPLRGYLILAAHLNNDPVKYSTGYNFGPETDDVRTVKDMVELSIQKWGGGRYESPELTNQPHEAGLLKLSIAKAKKELNWKPVFNSSDAVEWTMNWYKEGRTDSASYTLMQIRDYLGE